MANLFSLSSNISSDFFEFLLEKCFFIQVGILISYSRSFLALCKCKLHVRLLGPYTCITMNRTNNLVVFDFLFVLVLHI